MARSTTCSAPSVTRSLGPQAICFRKSTKTLAAGWAPYPTAPLAARWPGQTC
jgi:hypothetical protein